MDGYIAKPVRMNELNDALRQLFGQASIQRAS